MKKNLRKGNRERTDKEREEEKKAGKQRKGKQRKIFKNIKHKTCQDTKTLTACKQKLNTSMKELRKKVICHFRG